MSTGPGTGAVAIRVSGEPRLAREPVLATKLFIPPVRPKLVSRPRLARRLDAALSVPLLLISAPAGFGKTTLLATWIREKDEDASVHPSTLIVKPSFAWLSLDSPDNDPSRFVSYLIAALQSAWPYVGAAAGDWLRSPQPPPIDAVLTSLLNDLCKVTQHAVIVLDDYHVIDDLRVHEALTYLVERLPSQVHLVLAGRVDPPLPLARWRSRGWLAEIRSDDLRFSVEEAAAFLSQTMGLTLSPADVEVLEARTEGWIVGLQMAALSMQGQPAGGNARFIQAFGGSHRYILDYLVEEVLDRQPEAIKRFLLDTSILDRMCGTLCDALLRTGAGDQRSNGELSPLPPCPPAQEILEHLDRSNLFVVPLDDQRCWYRYHHLFADLLRSRLRQTGPSRPPVLHAHASAWYEANGLLAEAVRHALAADDDDRLARLIETHALAMLDYGELPTLSRWLDALDERTLQTRPWLCVARGWLEVYTSRLEAVEPALERAERALEAAPTPDTSHILGHIAAIRSYVLSQQGDKARSADLARAALAHLPEDDLMARGLAAGRLAHALRWLGDLAGSDEALATGIAISRASGHSHVEVDVTCDLGGLRMAQGRLHEAVAIFEEVLRRADQAAQPGLPRSPMLATACINLGWVLREWNDLPAATSYDLEGLRLAEQWGQKDVLRSGYYEVIRLYRATGDVEAARVAVQKVCDLTHGMSPWLHSIARAEEALFHLRVGELEPAFAWAQTCGLGPHDQPAFRCLGLYVALARVLAAQKQIDQALGLLARCLTLAERAGAMAHAIEILLLRALAWQSQEKLPLAREALARALALGRPERFVRTFVDEGRPTQALIAGYIRWAENRDVPGETRQLVAYALQLLAAFQIPAQTEAPLPDRPTPACREDSARLLSPEELTARELEVLRLMAVGLSNQEIAARLYLAEGTVKTHTHNIFGKLDVRSRTEAIHRARDLGLL